MKKITFEEIKDFTIVQLSISKNEIITETTCLAHDLGVAGDDGFEYMIDFSKQFKMSLEDFDSIEYFGNEDSGSIIFMFTYLYARFIKKTPARDLVDLPELSLGHLLICASLEKWIKPQA